MVNELDPKSWYSERELDFTPVHFVVSKTPITPDSRAWILENLRGRFSVIMNDSDTETSNPSSFFVLYLEGVPAFEDPPEALLYELTWS